ncbi:glycosyltransferase [Isoptericola sp. NPDC057191]|uniref:glycosyltransferase n=1 Tax=Isoptericola sp. NPDC057191 TaxID=3346041 RepID=UPI003631B523
MTAEASRPAPLRVAVLDHTAELGGAELALVRLCAELRRRADDPARPDVEVRVLLGADGPLRPLLEAQGTVVEVLPLDPGVRTTARGEVARVGVTQLRAAAAAAGYAWRLARRLRALRPDVVHTTSLKADLLGLAAARIARRPLVWHVHDRISPDYLPRPLVLLLRVLSRVPDAVVVNSSATAATLPVPAVVAYPGFAPGQERPAVATRDPGGHERDSGAPVVGIVGRLSPTKGQLELLRALPAVLAAHPGARLRVVGEATFDDPSYAGRLRRTAEELAVAHAVDWVGFVADPAAELDGFDVCVHASPVPEPFGQVVVESMIREVPVVATSAGGVLEILAPDDDGAPLGRLVPPGDASALGRAVVAALDDPAESRERARRAHAAALRRFPVARTADVVTTTWRRAAGRGRPPRP